LLPYGVAVRSVVAGLVVVAVLAMTACSGDDSTVACDLVKSSTAARILGEPTRAGVENDDNDGPGTSCEWVSEASTKDPQAAVYGFHIREKSGSLAVDEFETKRDNTSDPYEIDAVDGLGDDAYFFVYTEPNGISGTPSLPDLYIRVDDTVLSIGAYDSDEHPVTIPQARTIEGAAGKVAVLKLGGADT
jgi:hypothetical protein